MCYYSDATKWMTPRFKGGIARPLEGLDMGRVLE